MSIFHREYEEIKEQIIDYPELTKANVGRIELAHEKNKISDKQYRLLLLVQKSIQNVKKIKKNCKKLNISVKGKGIEYLFNLFEWIYLIRNSMFKFIGYSNLKNFLVSGTTSTILPILVKEKGIPNAYFLGKKYYSYYVIVGGEGQYEINVKNVYVGKEIIRGSMLFKFPCFIWPLINYTDLHYCTFRVSFFQRYDPVETYLTDKKNELFKEYFKAKQSAGPRTVNIYNKIRDAISQDTTLNPDEKKQLVDGIEKKIKLEKEQYKFLLKLKDYEGKKVFSPEDVILIKENVPIIIGIDAQKLRNGGFRVDEIGSYAVKGEYNINAEHDDNVFESKYIRCIFTEEKSVRKVKSYTSSLKISVLPIKKRIALLDDDKLLELLTE